MQFNIALLENLVKQEPNGNKEYIFITDNNELCESIICADYMSIIVDSNSVDEFNNFVSKSVVLSCNNIKSYKFLAVTSSKLINDKITENLSKLYLYSNASAWKIFNTKDKDINYFATHQEEVAKAISKFITRNDEKVSGDIYIADNCYYKNDKNNTKLSNFIIEPLALVRNSDLTLLKANFITENNRVFEKTISTLDFNDVRSFKLAINKDTLNLMFKANDRDLEDIKALISSYKYTERTGVKCVGIHKQDDKYYFVDSNKAVNSKAEINENIALIDDFKCIETDILSYDAITKEELESISYALLTFNEPAKVFAILGFCCSCFLKEFLFESCYKLNHLFLIGEAGSGKSTTVDNIIQPFFSLKQISAVGSLTNFTLIKNASSSNTIPFILEEYKPSMIHKTMLHRISDLLRNAYDRHITQRGKANQSINEYALLSPVVVVGEAGTEETALIERSIILNFSKRVLTKDMSESIAWLKNNRNLISKLGRLVLDTALETDVNFLKERHIIYEDYFRKHFKTDRVVNSLSNTMCGLELLVRAYAKVKIAFPYDATQIASSLIEVVKSDTLDDQESPTTAVESILEILDLMLSKEPLLSDYFTLINNDMEIAIDVRGVYPEFLKYIKDYNIQDIELLSQKQFCKQLRNTEYFLSYTDARFKTGKKKAYKLSLLKLSEKLELRAMNSNDTYSVVHNAPLPDELKN